MTGTGRLVFVAAWASRSVLVGLLVALAVAVGCRPQPATTVALPPAPTEPVWFEDVTERVGLKFVHDAGPGGQHRLPEIIGSGAAVFDFDGSGRLGIYLVQNAGPKSNVRNQLFRQMPDGRFEDVSAGSGVDVAGFGMGVAVADVNNDGLPDLFLTEYGGTRLFLNRGNGKFVDITETSGLRCPLWGTSASFFDFDRDGWLDLVVVNYVDYDPGLRCNAYGGKPDYCNPKSFPGSVVKLYRNLGPQKDGVVRFADVTLASKLAEIPGPGLGVLCADFDGDGWPDIFVANDGAPNRLWINRHDGTFHEEGMRRGVAYGAMAQPQGNMGVAFGDVDQDGLPDLFVTHLTEEMNTLWKQGPRGFFKDSTIRTGLVPPERRGTGFGTVMVDLNCDGMLDVAVVNGRVARPSSANLRPGPFDWQAYAERNALFANDGGGRFRDVSESNPALCGRPNLGRGLAFLDFDNDGGLDLLVTSIHGPARLLRNVCPGRGHWLTVRAIDPALKRDAYGATVTVACGKRSLTGLVNPGSSYLCSNDPRVHFGLGTADRVDSILIKWPDGVEEKFAGGTVDRFVELRKGTGTEPAPP